MFNDEANKFADPGAPTPGWSGSNDPLYVAELRRYQRETFYIQKIVNGWLISAAHPHSLAGHSAQSTHYVRCIEDISEKIAELHNAAQA